MSQISENRISRLAHLVVDGLGAAALVQFTNHAHALRESKRIMADFFSADTSLDEFIRQKIQSLSRKVPPGSREWEVLYRKYREEELKKRKTKP